MKKLFVLFFLSLSLVSALQINQGNNNNGGGQGNGNFQPDNGDYGVNVPYFASPAPIYVQRKRFELNTYTLQKLYKEIYQKYQKRSKILNHTFDLSILMQPAVKFIKPVNLIYVNPQFITQIIFPPKFKITSAVAGFGTNVFVYAGNELHFRVKRDFVNGNMIVYLTDGKKNLSINLLVENYNQKECKIIKGRVYCLDVQNEKNKRVSGYKYAYSNFALVYKFLDRKPLEPLEVIAMYNKLTGKPLNIKKDGEYVEFEYKNINYFIYRNDKFGNIIYKGKKYIVKP